MGSMISAVEGGEREEDEGVGWGFGLGGLCGMRGWDGGGSF